MELLDTPGILWPKFQDRDVGLRLAFIGSMNDEILVIREMALELLDFLIQSYPRSLEERYGMKLAEIKGGTVGILEEIARVRKCYLKGEEPDYDRAASLLIEDFRNGRLGRITLELPETDRKTQNGDGVE